MADTERAVNETPVYIPSLGKAFGPGAWDFDKSEPTGEGRVYDGDEWQRELNELHNPEPDPNAERKPGRVRKGGRKAASTEQTPEEEA